MIWDSCGVVLEFLRSCYKTKAKIFKNSDEPTWITYYFAPEGASIYEGESWLRSNNWVTSPDQHTGLGEIHGEPKIYRKGKLPALIFGVNPCLDPFDLKDGFDATVYRQLSIDGNGIPLCCPQTNAGLEVGGQAHYFKYKYHETNPDVETTCCTTGTPSNLICYFNGDENDPYLHDQSVKMGHIGQDEFGQETWTGEGWLYQGFHIKVRVKCTLLLWTATFNVNGNIQDHWIALGYCEPLQLYFQPLGILANGEQYQMLATITLI